MHVRYCTRPCVLTACVFVPPHRLHLTTVGNEYRRRGSFGFGSGFSPSDISDGALAFGSDAPDPVGGSTRPGPGTCNESDAARSADAVCVGFAVGFLLAMMSLRQDFPGDFLRLLNDPLDFTDVTADALT